MLQCLPSRRPSKILLFILMFCLTTPYSHALIKELGMGDIGVAYPQDSGVPRYNPAGIIDLDDRQDYGYGISHQRGQTDFHGSQDQLIFPDSYQTNTQASWQLLGIGGFCKRITENITIGSSLDATRSFRSKCPQGFPALGQGKVDVDLVSPLLLLTAAYRITPAHAVGLTLVQGVSRLSFCGFQNAAVNSVSPENVSNRGFNWAYGVGLRVGYLCHITPKLNFGASYSSRLIFSTRYKKYKGFIPDMGRFDAPNQVYLGFAYRATCRTTLAAQFLYVWWSQLPSLYNGTFYNPNTGLAGINQHPAGSKKGPGPGWRDGLNVSIGADFQVNNALTVRGGVILGRSLFPRRETPSNAQNNLFVLKNVLELGATYVWTDWEFNVSYGHIFYRKVKGVPQSVYLGGTFDISYAQDGILLGLSKLL